MIVARFFFFSKSDSRWLFSGSELFVEVFFEPGVARRFFFLTSLPVADNVPTTVFIFPIFLLLGFCFYRTTHDLGLGVQLITFRTGTAATIATAAVTPTTIEELRSEFWLYGWAAVEGKDTRLHWHTRPQQTTP